MSEHITFSEMESFLTSTGISGKFIADCARMTRHIKDCAPCAAQYRAMLDVQQLPYDIRLIRLQKMREEQTREQDLT